MRHLTLNAERGISSLAEADPVLAALLEREHIRQADTLMMVASCSAADSSVLVCEASTAANVTTEGYPGARYHAGCEVVDDIERLAVQRARVAFGADYANVQPYSGSAANYAVLTSLMDPGDTLLGLDLDAGGHLTHGASMTLSGRMFRTVGYRTDERGFLDYDRIRSLAIEHRPRVIVCGASAYPRVIDFARFRAIADEVSAFLIADISHIAGLVVAGIHPSPVQHAHVTTTSTYKQLCGPRGGLILCGPDASNIVAGGRTLASAMQSAVFPRLQGTPSIGAIAAKARALHLAGQPEFREFAARISANAATMAGALGERGYRLVTGGTDNHMVVVDLSDRGVTGAAAEAALEACGIVVNRNVVPGDRRRSRLASGIRLGTNVLAQRRMTAVQIGQCVALLDDVLSALRPTETSAFELDRELQHAVRDRVAKLCNAFPLEAVPDARPLVPTT